MVNSVLNWTVGNKWENEDFVDESAHRSANLCLRLCKAFDVRGEKAQMSGFTLLLAHPHEVQWTHLVSACRLDALNGQLATSVSFKTRQTRFLIQTTKRGRRSNSWRPDQRCSIRAASTETCATLLCNTWVFFSVSLSICSGHSCLKQCFTGVY